MPVLHDIRLSLQDPAVEETAHPRAAIEPACQYTDLFEHQLRPMAV